jgi:hypothetical protein
MAEEIAHHFDNCRRTTATSAMDVFVPFEWANFNTLSPH